MFVLGGAVAVPEADLEAAADVAWCESHDRADLSEGVSALAEPESQAEDLAVVFGHDRGQALEVLIDAAAWRSQRHNGALVLMTNVLVVDDEVFGLGLGHGCSFERSLVLRTDNAALAATLGSRASGPQRAASSFSLRAGARLHLVASASILLADVPQVLLFHGLLGAARWSDRLVVKDPAVPAIFDETARRGSPSAQVVWIGRLRADRFGEICGASGDLL